MNKKILIISSDHTGHGHKSITESLCEKINEKNNLDIHIVDGFSLGGKALSDIGRSYAPITRVSEKLWGGIWKLSAMIPNSIDKFIQMMIEKNFITLLEKIKPDLILSVHPNFNGSVINILEKRGMRIPFVTLIADLVNIYPLWADKRVDYVISPTIEAKDKCLKFGVSEEKVKVIGFPSRARFYKKDNERFKSHSTLQFLIMSGGEGVGNMKKIAENLLENYDCHVKIIAGRNEKLKNELENSLKDTYGSKIEVFGFIKNVQELMLSSDIAFTRGSPNVMFEAFAANLPIVITGALPGQEKDNPLFAEKYNLGVICKKPKNIKSIIDGLLANDREKLNKIKQSQSDFIDRNTAQNIVDFLSNIDLERNSLFESFPSYDKLEIKAKKHV